MRARILDAGIAERRDLVLHRAREVGIALVVIGRAGDEVGRLLGHAVALVLGLHQRLPVERADEMRRRDDEEIGLRRVAADVFAERDHAVDQRQAERRRALAEAETRGVGNDDAAIDAASHGWVLLGTAAILAKARPGAK